MKPKWKTLKEIFLWIYLVAALYRGVSVFVYALNHPEKTGTQLLLSWKEAWTWQTN